LAGAGRRRIQHWPAWTTKCCEEKLNFKLDHAFRLYLSASNLKRATAQLKSLQIPEQKQNQALWIQDPDGNRIFFVKARPT